MRRLIGLGLLAASAASIGSDRVPPAPHCLDARDVTQVRRVANDVLSVQTSAGYFRVRLTEACTSDDQIAATSLISPAGWACGRDDEYIRVGQRICGIAAVQPLAPAEHARLLRDSDQLAYLDAVMLGTLEVEGKRPRNGFSGTTEYCFNPRHVRGWNDTKHGVVVETSPLRAGGNRWYRVELEGACPELSSVQAVEFHSGVGIGAICGNAGDKLVGRAVGPNDTDTQGTEGFVNAARGLAAGFGCAISAVYPIDGASTAQR